MSFNDEDHSANLVLPANDLTIRMKPHDYRVVCFLQRKDTERGDWGTFSLTASAKQTD